MTLVKSLQTHNFLACLNEKLEIGWTVEASLPLKYVRTEKKTDSKELFSYVKNEKRDGVL
jgi:hypothetical protein